MELQKKWNETLDIEMFFSCNHEGKAAIIAYSVMSDERL